MLEWLVLDPIASLDLIAMYVMCCWKAVCQDSATVMEATAFEDKGEARMHMIVGDRLGRIGSS